MSLILIQANMGLFRHYSLPLSEYTRDGILNSKLWNTIADAVDCGYCKCLRTWFQYITYTFSL